MGTTLQNGVYLPSEGERNCYAGLKTNWEILDQKVADVTALQQAVAGALHREIVASLPTTDIDPNTIYMILSGTSATENVYNEFMYVNNAWELIGTSATDLTNYYTKGDVDGLLVLKANASDLTSHTGDTTIHVTSADKTKWNTVALIKQLRLVNTQVGSATTIAFANIDDTNGIKVGDKCMDLDAKMFEITAVDTTNQTVTVGTALIDLALDANVVHTNRNDDVSIPLNSTSAELGVTGGSTNITFSDKNGKNLSGLTLGNYVSSKLSYVRLSIFDKDVNDNEIQDILEYSYVSNNANAYLRVSRDNFCTLGSVSYRWKGVYATNYYYGSNNVEFSTKFVTTDTAQTISGSKTFTDNVKIKNTDVTRGTTTGSGTKNITYTDSNDDELSSISVSKNSNGSTSLVFKTSSTDNTDTVISSSFQFFVSKSGSKVINPTTSDEIALGRSTNKWLNVATSKVNNLEPSSLSLPNGNINSFVDISGYFTNTGTGETNTYPVTANGWIYLRLSNISGCQAEIYDSSNNRLYATSTSGSIEQVMIPVVSGVTFKTQWATGSAVTVNIARFIPCQGNI